MSFVMIASGSTRGTGMRTVSMRCVIAIAVAAVGLLLATGTGLGYWLFAPAPVAGAAVPSAAATVSPFAVEQMGMLSGRLFKLESQAGQLSESLRHMLGRVPKASASSASAAGRGGPMLPPRASGELTAIDVAAMNLRLHEIEKQIAQVANAATLQHLELQHLPTHLPLQGAELSSSFGNRDDPITGRRAFHAGVDFAAAHGTPIRAAAAGTVIFADFNAAYGWSVEIAHGNGLVTRYAHASRLLVARGAAVRQGETIAQVGSSGRATGPHLHFEVLKDGDATDPRRYLAGL
jgi:murein DD-endopeptidase MepM/ murein hydrolase activator NlpD